jgi:hypothetical protein
MEHQSLCSATGMPHSTQTRMRWMGSLGLPPNSFLNKDTDHLPLNAIEYSIRWTGATCSALPAVGDSAGALSYWLPGDGLGSTNRFVV